MIHRDIKPENIMLGAHGEVYLLDWGIALLKEQSEGASRVLLGTPAYMAPEMAVGDVADMGPHTDVYLLGATLHEILTGTPIHSGKSLHALLKSAILSAPVVFDSSVPLELAEIVNKATAARKEDRYPSARALRDALMAYLEHRGSLKISAAGLERLSTLKQLLGGGESSGEAYHDEIQACFTECQFSFLLALREWPDNASATEGLQRCLEQMICHELAQGHPKMAVTMLKQLPTPQAELAEEVEEQMRLHARAQAQAERGLKMQRELDFDQNINEKIFGMVAILVLTTTVLVFTWTSGDGSQHEKKFDAWLLSVVISACFGGGISLSSRRLMTTIMNRRIAVQAFLIPASILCNRSMAMLTSVSFEQMLAWDLMVASLVLFSGGGGIHRLLWIGATMLLAGMGLALSWPEHSAQIFGISMTSMCGVWALILIHSKRTRAPKMS